MPHIMFAPGVQTDSLGRNGVMTTTGVSVMGMNFPSVGSHGYVLLEPITSRGDVGRGSISFPIENAADVCLTLMREVMGNMSQMQREAFLEQSRELIGTPKAPYPVGSMFRVSTMDDTMPGQILTVTEEPRLGGKIYIMEAPLDGSIFDCSEGWLSTFCDALPLAASDRLSDDHLTSIRALRLHLHSDSLEEDRKVLISAEELKAILTYNPHLTRSSFFHFAQRDIIDGLDAAEPGTVFRVLPVVLSDIAKTLGMTDITTEEASLPDSKVAPGRPLSPGM